jgi:hypothetical protein
LGSKDAAKRNYDKDFLQNYVMGGKKQLLPESLIRNLNLNADKFRDSKELTKELLVQKLIEPFHFV